MAVKKMSRENNIKGKGEMWNKVWKEKVNYVQS